MKALTETDFHFDGQKNIYHGKMCDVYNINDDLIAMVVADRVSVFDVILPKGIPFKEQVLNQIVTKFLDSIKDIYPNWKIVTPGPMVTISVRCEGFRVEMIIRSILAGSARCEYNAGARELCDMKLPDGMKKNECFPEPIVTPATKADEGRDLNISKEEITNQGIVPAEDYAIVEDYTHKSFACGQEIAAKQGLTLMGTEYEFGKKDGKIHLIDETHTPDSSRHFYVDGYGEKLAEGEPRKRLSEEFVRQWLIERNFTDEPGQTMPEITGEYAESISEYYTESYEHIAGEEFKKVADHDDLATHIEKSVSDYLASLK